MILVFKYLFLKRYSAWRNRLEIEIDLSVPRDRIKIGKDVGLIRGRRIILLLFTRDRWAFLYYFQLRW